MVVTVCVRLCSLVWLTISATKSTSRMRDSAEEMFSWKTPRLLMVCWRRFCTVVCASRRRHTRLTVTGVQTCALPILQILGELLGDGAGAPQPVAVPPRRADGGPESVGAVHAERVRDLGGVDPDVRTKPRILGDEDRKSVV